MSNSVHNIRWGESKLPKGWKVFHFTFFLQNNILVIALSCHTKKRKLHLRFLLSSLITSVTPILKAACNNQAASNNLPAFLQKRKPIFYTLLFKLETLNEPAYKIWLLHKPVLNALGVSIPRYYSKYSAGQCNYTLQYESPGRWWDMPSYNQPRMLKDAMSDRFKSHFYLWVASAWTNTGTPILCNCLHRYGIKCKYRC